MIRKLPLLAAIVLLAQFAQAQQPKTDTTEVTVRVIKKESGDSMIVDAAGRKWTRTTSAKAKNIITQWWGIDIGFSNFADRTRYASADAQAYAPGLGAEDFDLRNGKSINVNLWIFNQQINLIKHIVNLKYAVGLELNNYRYKSNIRYADNSQTNVITVDNAAGGAYKKTKLAADYLTVPVMLNFNFSSGKTRVVKDTRGKRTVVRIKNSPGYGFSAGISAGYLYSARNKFINAEEGKNKLKGNFGLRPWKISYIGEVNLGLFSVYGSYASKSMYRHGLDMTPYNVGLRFGF